MQDCIQKYDTILIAEGYVEYKGFYITSTCKTEGELYNDFLNNKLGFSEIIFCTRKHIRILHNPNGYRFGFLRMYPTRMVLVEKKINLYD